MRHVTEYRLHRDKRSKTSCQYPHTTHKHKVLLSGWIMSGRWTQRPQKHSPGSLICAADTFPEPQTPASACLYVKSPGSLLVYDCATVVPRRRVSSFV